MTSLCILQARRTPRGSPEGDEANATPDTKPGSTSSQEIGIAHRVEPSKSKLPSLSAPHAACSSVRAKDGPDPDMVLQEEQQAIADRLTEKRKDLMPVDVVASLPASPQDDNEEEALCRSRERARLQSRIDELEHRLARADVGANSPQLDLHALLSPKQEAERHLQLDQHLHLEKGTGAEALEQRVWLEEARRVQRTLAASQDKLLQSAFLAGYIEHSTKEEVQQEYETALEEALEEAEMKVSKESRDPFVDVRLRPSTQAAPKKLQHGSQLWEEYLSHLETQTQASNILAGLAKAWRVRRSLARLHQMDRLERAKASRSESASPALVASPPSKQTQPTPSNHTNDMRVLAMPVEERIRFTTNQKPNTLPMEATAAEETVEEFRHKPIECALTKPVEEAKPVETVEENEAAKVEEGPSATDLYKDYARDARSKGSAVSVMREEDEPEPSALSDAAQC